VDAQQAKIDASKQKPATGASKPKPSNGDTKRLKTLQNALKKAEAAVTTPTALETAMLTLDGTIADKSKLYTRADITKMCVDAMKLSFAQNQGFLKGGIFSITPANVGAKVNIRLLEGDSHIRSCFPVI
jgi:hypothetical protein